MSELTFTVICSVKQKGDFEYFHIDSSTFDGHQIGRLNTNVCYNIVCSCANFVAQYYSTTVF